MKEKQTVEELDLALTKEETTNLAKAELSLDQDRFVPSFQQAKDFKTGRRVAKIVTFTFLTIFALFMLIPFWFMIVTSLKSPVGYEREIASNAVKLYTNNPSFINFQIILGGNIQDTNAIRKLLPLELISLISSGGRRVNFVPYFLNTTIVAIVSTAFTVVTTVLCSFAFARLEFKGKNLLFAILLATMMVPGEMMLLTNFETTSALGWTNTFAALIFVHGVSVFYIFYLRQTFQQIPNELFLAAKVDGYGEFQYLWRVMIPIAMPTIVTIIILNAMGSWNAFIWPSLVASGNNEFLKGFGIEHTMQLVSNGLMSLFSGDYGSWDTVKIAGSMVISAPLLIVFVFFRKYIMRGVSRSGIKG